MKRIKSFFAAGLLAASLAGVSAAPMVQEGDKLAIIGDSITEQRQYTNSMECYILACAGLKNVSIMQFGWGGETANGYVRRMAAAYNFFPATVATTLYGMNDGGYKAYDANTTGRHYEANSGSIAKFMKEKGVKFLAASPGAVDIIAYRRIDSAIYNNALNEMGKLGEKVATANGAKFLNMHQLLMDTMAAAQKEKGATYFVCGGDGVHPGPNGQLVMAYGFLKALGFDGAIGQIEMDFAGGKATATEGHKVLSAKAGSVEMESSRYPFIFTAGETANQNASILPFLPFNKDLNRFMLVVKNFPGEVALVQFGNGKKTFTKAQLEQGINLADAFIADTPFRPAFEKLSQTVRRQQDFETWIHKIFLLMQPSNRFPAMAQEKAVADAEKTLVAAVRAERETLEAASRAAVVPVKYTITVSKEK